MTEFEPGEVLSDLISGSFSGESGEYAVILFVFVIFIAIIIGAAISSGYIRLILNIAGFAHPVARVRSIGNPLVEKEKLRILAESHFPDEMMEHLRQFGYEIPLHRMYTEDESERFLREEYYRSMEKLLDSVPGSVRPFFIAYLKFSEAEEVKYILRAARGGTDLQAVSVGRLNTVLIRKLAHAESSGEIKAILKELDLISPDQEIGEISAVSLEELIDRHLYHSFINASGQVDVSLAEPIGLFAGHAVDIRNLKNISRAVSLGLDREDKLKQLIDGGIEFHGERLRDLASCTTAEAVTDACRGTLYQTALEKASGSGDPEKEMDNLLLETGASLAVKYHLGSGPLIRFAFARRIEHNNLIIAYNGVSAGMPAEEIMNMMAWEGAL
ncbi:V-type ATPase subunit [Methanoplanus endosymbiosus]|uniref:V-type ATPase subunit n=1 Tax=Methanoplanus endosymbiosus TaxID=33865 RepID=A0A9E7PPG8_9EURY|nr:V-type ATPase subunit [Methanoplanus endosymbiosus]UUX92651.1 V-type ATPase subunit [Methanoplanus endosymbiosus]